MLSLKSVFTRLIELLKVLQSWGGEPGGARTTGLEDVAGPGPPSFEELMATRVSSDNITPLVAGFLELAGLAGPPDGTGQESASDIRTVVEHEIGAALDHGDFFRRVDDATYVICFATQDSAAADSRAKALSEAIRSRVATDFPVLESTFSVESTTSSIDPQELMHGGSLTDNLLRVLRKVREDMRHTVSQQRVLLERHFQVQYLPAVKPAKCQFALNHCLLQDDRGGLSQLRAIADPQDLERTLAELDLRLLTRAIEGLHDALKKGACAPLLVPVNFKTLASGVYARRYGVLAAAIPERYRALLTLELIGLPADEASSAAAKADVFREIPISRLAVQVPLDHGSRDRLSLPGLWAISVSLAGRTSIEPGLAGSLAAFASNAGRLGLLSIAHQANSVGLAKLAAEAHVSFVDGSAISAPCSTPKAPSPAPTTLFGRSNARLRAWP